MKNPIDITKLSQSQQTIFNSVVLAYKKRLPLNSRIIFTKTNNYLPPLFKHGKVFEHPTDGEFITNLVSYGASPDKHDGCVFVYPNGRVVFGGVVDTLKLISTLPVTVKDYGVARAVMKILTNYEASSIYCALKCSKSLILYSNGVRQVMYRPHAKKEQGLHNYGMGLIVADELPKTTKAHLLKMGAFKRHANINSTLDLAGKIYSISHNREHHDGFWHYSPANNTVSGPYLVLMTIPRGHAKKNMGMKRLTASLASHLLRIPTIVIREESSQLICYGDVSSEFIAELQKAFDSHISCVTADISLSIPTS